MAEPNSFAIKADPQALEHKIRRPKVITIGGLFDIIISTSMEDVKLTDSLQNFRWSQEHSKYVCGDGAKVGTRSQIAEQYFEKYWNKCGGNIQEARRLSNGIVHYINRAWGHESKSVNIVISRTQLTRDMETIVKCGVGIRTIVFPRSVQRISEQAWSCNRSLASIVINNGLKKLKGDYANKRVSVGDLCVHSPFYESAVRKVRLPPGLELGDSAFANLRTLKTVYLPEGLSRIGDKCFSESGITQLTIPASVQRVGRGALHKCNQLEVVEFAENSQLEDIDQCAFSGCSKLRTVNFGKSSVLKRIGSRAFQDSGLESFTCPSSLRIIEDGVFAGCRSLQHIELNEGLLEVGPFCFAGTPLVHVSLPEQVAMTDEELGIECSYTEYHVFPEVERVQRSDVNDHNVDVFVVPACVRELGDRAFEYNRHLHKIIFRRGSRLERIGKNCFGNGCQHCQLEKIAVPDGVTEIPEEAFRYCERLKSVTFGANSKLEKIGSRAFQWSGLESFTAPPSLRVIEDGAFSGCKQLQHVELNLELQAIGLLCFAGAPLTQVVLPKQIAITDEELGIGCPHTTYHILPNLECIRESDVVEQNAEIFVVPACVRELGDGAFKKCRSIRKIIFRSGNRLERIGKECFYGNWFEELMIPSTVVEIQNRAFIYGNLKMVVFAENSQLKKIEGGTFWGSKIESFVAPPSLREIGDCAFSDCMQLRNVELNEGLESIESSCFESSSIEQLVIPASVKRIGCRAFQQCSELTKIAFAKNSQLEDIGEMPLDSGITVYVKPGMEFDIEANIFSRVTIVRLPQPSEV